MSIRLGFVRCLLAASMVVSVFLSTNVVAQTPEKTTTQTHPFAKRLEGVYLKYLDAARTGDVKATLALMTSEYSKMADKITPDLLIAMSRDDLDPRDSQFVGVDVTPNKTNARAVYQKLGAITKDWTAVVFRNEGGEWKIAKLLRRNLSGTETKDGLQELIQESDAYMAR
jgi:hypothetical protein